MKVKFKLKTDHSAANFKHAVGKDELRIVMHGVGLDFKNSCLYATDAHILVRYDVEIIEREKSSHLDRISIPVNVFDKTKYSFVDTKKISMDNFEYEYDTETDIVEVRLDFVDEVLYREKIIEGNYPDAKAVMNFNASEIGHIGIDLKLSERLRKAMYLKGSSGVFTFKFQATNKAILVNLNGEENVKGLMMPVHLEN